MQSSNFSVICFTPPVERVTPTRCIPCNWMHVLQYIFIGEFIEPALAQAFSLLTFFYILPFSSLPYQLQAAMVGSPRAARVYFDRPPFDI